MKEDLQNLNKLYYIAESITLRGVQTVILDFPKLAPKAFWKNIIWKELKEVIGYDLKGHGSTAVLLKRKRLQEFDDIIGKYYNYFVTDNKWSKTVPQSEQLTMFERNKGFYPDVSDSPTEQVRSENG